MGSSKSTTAAKASKAAVKKVTKPKAAAASGKKPSPPSKATKAAKVVAPLSTKKTRPSVPAPSVVPDVVSAIPAAPIRLASFEPTIDEGANPGHILNDEVLDETEQAQMLQLQEQAAISFRAREMNRPETHPDFDGKHCVDCDDEIPPQRLALCRVRCVHCQKFLEEDRKRHQRTMG